ncbi:MAG TPA: LUD domain-containing protein [Oligoflexia bacterium]|nr:LUD domain-containing protein [Oligoflexia bacterium]
MPCPSKEFGPLFFHPEDNAESRLDWFREKFIALRGELYEEQGERQAAQRILELISGLPGFVQVQKHPLLERLQSELPALRERLAGSRALDCASPEYAQCACGISGADSLLAQSGSIVLRSSAAGGRRLSVLPPFHIVVAASSQLNGFVAPWFAGLQQDNSWSLASIISGPSRTADIEKILVFGAHGPKRLALVLVTGS